LRQYGSAAEAVLRLGVVLLLAVGVGACEQRDPRLNVLLVSLDTTRADRLGCYGYEKDTSPHIDALAEDGILFTNAVAPAALTNVTHASLFTGRNPFNHGVRFLLDARMSVLADDQLTLAEVLRAEGWQTGAVVSAAAASSNFGLNQGFDLFDESFVEGDGHQRPGNSTLAVASEWLESASEPFLLWTHFFDPHDPKILPPLEICDRFKPERVDNVLLNRIALYDAEVYFMDQMIGQLLERLDGLGLRERTIVVVVADHGESHGEHDWWGHGVIYQQQIRVPLIIRLPGGPSGLRVDQLVRTIDVAPTLLSWLDVDPLRLPHVDGVDLSQVVSGNPASAPTSAYSEAVNMQVYSLHGKKWLKTDKQYALTTDRWKFIYHQLRPAESELFDLLTDPDEEINLHGTGLPIEEELARELRRLDPMVEEISGLVQPDDRVIKALESLGYVN